MKISKKITALFIAVMMVVSAIPFTASAANEPYLTFTGTESFSIKTNNSAKNWDGTLQYSTDANTWTIWDGTSQISSANNKLYLRGTGNTKITGDNSSKYWVITTHGTVACNGDIRTLLDYTEPESSSMGIYCFAYLFRNCTSLTAAPKLPATILNTNCYSYMFRGCTRLTTAPELPATMLAMNCYSNMFNGCTSLTTAPELPATTLTSACYYSMFQDCRSLTTAPELPATMLASDCYANMFYGCESLTTAPELPATALTNYCYYNMFNGCRSLTTAPELWATTLTKGCYTGMFQDCRSLTTAPELPANDLEKNCYSNMFNGCTSLTTPSELWATDLTDGCYNSMFRGCTGIKLSTEKTAEYSVPYSIPEEGTGTTGTDSLTDMFTGTGGTFKGTPSINTTYYIAAPAPTGVAAIGNVGYPTLEAALAAATAGDTVTLLQDIDYSTTYTERNARDNGREHIIDLKDCTLDLNGYTISTINGTVEFCGNGATIENGTFNLIPKNTNGSYKEGSYALIIDNSGTGNYGANGKVTVNDVTCVGAVNVKQATVELNNVTARTTPTKFYAVWAEDYATVTINSGTYTDAQSGGRGVLATGTSSGETGAVIEVKGGTFEASNKIVAGAEENSILISGGTFSKPVAQKYCANGYIPTTTPDAQGKYTVNKADNGVSITVDSTIDTNFYLDNDYPSTGYVKTTYNANSNSSETAEFTSETKQLSELGRVVGGDYAGYYTLSVPQAPAQITEDIIVEVYAADDTLLYTKNYNAADYCNDIIAGDYDAKLKTLAQATLDYGAAANDYFEYGAVSAASDYADRISGVTPSGVTAQTAGILTGAALVVVAEPQIKLFTNGPVAVNSASNANAAAEESGDKNFIRVTGIAPANFGQTFTVNTSAGEISMSMNTILGMMAGDANMAMLAKGMYNYGTAAAAYFAG